MASSDITNVMTAIVGNLMPVCAKDANPELWLVYNQMQQWALCAQHKVPEIGGNQSLRNARIIFDHLGKLRDRKLAREIGRVIRLHTPGADVTTRRAAH
jgi:hypothetical protein